MEKTIQGFMMRGALQTCDKGDNLNRIRRAGEAGAIIMKNKRKAEIAERTQVVA